MVITFVGDNQHARSQAVRDEIEAFINQHGSLAVERYDAAESEPEHILSAVESSSLLSPEKMVAIDNYETNKPLTDQTETLLEKVLPGVRLLININKLDKRAAFGKLLQKSTDFRVFSALSAGETAAWLVDLAEEKGGSLDRATAQYLIEYVGSDQNGLQNELDKLILYDPKITRDTIHVMCQPQPTSTIFDLLDAGFRGQHQRALQLYDEQRRQQVEPLAIMSMIAWQLHIISLVMLAGDRPAATIAKDAGVHPFVVQKTKNLVSRLKLAQLRSLLDDVLALEVAMKSRPIQADDAIKHFLMNL